MQNLNTARLGLALTTAALILSACGGDPSPEPQPTEQAGLISGVVQPMKPTTTSVFPVNGAVETPGTSFTAAVQPNGNFDLALPTSATLNANYASDLNSVKSSYSYCDRNLDPNATFTTNAPDDMKMLQINELSSNDGRTLIASSNGGATFREWWYVDRDYQLTFTGTNCFSIGDVSADLALKKGWNVIEHNWKAVGDKNVTTYQVIAQPTARTVYTDSSMAAQSVKGFNINMLRPWQNPANLR